MSDVIAKLVKFAGILFALLLLGFTGYQTWSLLFEVTSNPFIATLGLVVFEGGMLYWWFYFQTGAQGLGQMALSIGMFLVGLLLVCGATALHLGAVGAETFGADTPAKLITAAVIANVIAKFFMPLMSPETLLAAKTKAVEGKILDKSFKMLDSKADDMSQDLAGSISDDMLTDLRQKILATRRRPTLIEGQAHYKDSGPSPLSAPVAYPNGRPPVKAEKDAPTANVHKRLLYEVLLITHDGRTRLKDSTYDLDKADETARAFADAAPPGTKILIRADGHDYKSYTVPVMAAEPAENGRPTHPQRFE